METDEEQQLKQLSQLNPDIITRYLESTSRMMDASNAPSQEDDNDALPESEDDEETLENVLSALIHPISSARANVAPAVVNLQTVSSMNSPRPFSMPVSRPPTPWHSSPPPSLPPSSLGLSEHTDTALPEGPPFREFYWPGQKPAISNYSQDAQPVIQMVIDKYKVQICTIDVFSSEKASLGWMDDIWAQAMQSQGEDWVLTECT
ncbi:hypothetical protein BDQ17DRAFT_1436290 [Cyathus striatus]|nr:hypothetical protein BDQ17DRAFT_1436290 [Cyathus striatus]